jgi:antitoxin (DNA-binding transcriptional repressor) of toxin-antitoxin stability system
MIIVKLTTISVTDAARNFADCLNRAHYQNVTFVLLKNGAPYARLVPDGQKVCTGRELTQALSTSDLPKNEALAWRRDVIESRKNLKAPKNRWR